MLSVHTSPKHKALVVPFADSLQGLFPNAKELNLAGANHLVLPHGPVETYMLRKLGYDAPSPILTQYDWPHPADEPPFDVQKKTAAMLTMEPRSYVLNSMGSGKTRSLLWALDYLRGNKLCGPALIFAPLSTISFVWASEVFATTPHRKCVVLHGTKKQRLQRLSEPDVDIFVVNHDGITVLQDELLARTDIDVLIIDELAVFRNGQAAFTKAMRKLAGRMKWVWGATGEPTPHSPTDVWAQCSIVTPNTVPKYFGRFREELMTKINMQWFPKPDAVERAFTVMQPAVRYSLEDVAELPEAIGLNPPRMVEIPLGVNQLKVYKEIADKCYSAVQSKEITAVNAASVMTKLLQIAAGWVYSRDGSIIALDNAPRVKALIDAVNASNRKVLIFVGFKHALAGISAALAKEGIEYAEVSGDTPAGERDRIFGLFQNTNKFKVLNAHPECCAHGLTLTAADTVIWFSPVTSLEIYNQANARIRRVGQQHKQLYLHFSSTPVEKRLYTMLAAKQRVQDKLLGLFEEASRGFVA